MVGVMLDFHLILLTTSIMWVLTYITLYNEFSQLKPTFRLLLAISALLCLAYSTIVLIGLYTLVFETSFLTHLRDGDLIPHLTKAIPLLTPALLE